MTVVQTSLFDDLDSFKEYCQIYFGLSLSLGLSDVFLVVRLELQVLGRKSMEVKYPSRPIISRVHTVHTTYHCC